MWRRVFGEESDLLVLRIDLVALFLGESLLQGLLVGGLF
jgi:hypothetical protein